MAQRDNGFQARLIGGVGRVGGQRDVIADPDRLEAGVLGQPRAPRERLRRDVLALVQPIQTELHRRSP
jgi:hypothetical protein